MSKLKGHFGGIVRQMDAHEATIRIERIGTGPWNTEAGDEVKALRADFMNQMPGPSKGSYVEGNVEHDPQTGQDRFINIVRPV